MIKKEIRYFFTALMFFTRIPCPSWTDHSNHYLNKSRKYFPFIGWIVGGIAAIIFWVFALIFPVSIAIVISTISSVWVTGAFHEDGFADVCDAFGGGWTKEQILKIMKDSRIGAYGGIGMLLIVLLKLFTLIEIAKISIPLTAICLVCSHASSRFVASTFIQTHEYVQDIDKSKSKPIANQKFSFLEMLYSVSFALIPLFLLKGSIGFVALLISYSSKIYLGHYFKKHIGGYTGDCLGATQQVSEVIFYLSVLGLWNYM